MVLPMTLASDLLIQPIKSNVELKIQPHRYLFYHVNVVYQAIIVLTMQ